MSDLLKTIEITVMSKTADDLEYLGQKSQLTTGEVVDRLTARISSKDPEVAYALIMDDLLLLMAHLSQEDKIKVMSDVVVDHLLAFPPEFMDELVAEAKEKRRAALKKMENLTSEQKAELATAYQDYVSGAEQRGPEEYN